MDVAIVLCPAKYTCTHLHIIRLLHLCIPPSEIAPMNFTLAYDEELFDQFVNCDIFSEKKDEKEETSTATRDGSQPVPTRSRTYSTCTSEAHENSNLVASAYFFGGTSRLYTPGSEYAREMSLAAASNWPSQQPGPEFFVPQQSQMIESMVWTNPGIFQTNGMGLHAPALPYSTVSSLQLHYIPHPPPPVMSMVSSREGFTGSEHQAWAANTPRLSSDAMTQMTLAVKTSDQTALCSVPATVEDVIFPVERGMADTHETISSYNQAVATAYARAAAIDFLKIHKKQ